jgi:hypothetical protein
VHQPNDQLRRARERIPSRQSPGACLSRQEVAELVNEWIYERTGRRVELDDNYIGKLERGVIRWPNKLYRQALRTILRAGSDAEIGFYSRRRTREAVSDVDRQQFLRLASTVAALPWLDLFTPPTPTPVPAKIGEADIDHIRSATLAFRKLDNTHGGTVGREAAFAQLRWSAQLLQAECPERLRADLFSTVAYLAGVTGYMAFDGYAHDDARRAFHFGLQCAEQAGNWHLRAHILNLLSRQATWCGQPLDGLTYADRALLAQDRLTATERASLRTQQARALARMGRVQDTLAAVGVADEEYARANPSDAPAWMNFYDHAQHHTDTGQALYDLAIAGRKTQSGQRLAYAVAHHAKPYARSRAMTQIKLASLLMATGDPHQAAAVGHQGLNAAANLNSRRAAHDLRELQRRATQHHEIADVVALADRISDRLGPLM